ncbi:MAG: TonB-dependent receptor [Bacteroidota bacterium]
MRIILPKSILLGLMALLLPVLASAQGVTTASIAGRITDATDGEALIGATVQAVHTPSGTVYGNVTDLDGFYRISGMRVGGPYTITITYTGYGETRFENVLLRLGESKQLPVALESSATDLTTIQVVAQIGTAGENAGASTQISTESIEAMPTLNRNLNDYVRLTPQASGTGGGGTSFGGVNNRYNAIYIDGAVNNDVFGLNSSGTNGGATGIAPFSIDIIDQIQVVLSPYDVTLGGFAGGGVNAVTKSGTNEFSGTAYYFLQNESLAGKTNGTLAERLGDDFERTDLDPFTQNTYGASLGGPIIKDKVFFFVNAEVRQDETPQPFEFGTYDGDASEADLNNLRDFLINNYRYDPGGFGNVSEDLEGLSLFGKLDFNLGKNHRLTLRHNYTRGERFERRVSNTRRINFSNNGVFRPSVTNSSALELNSNFGNRASNNLIIGYTTVVDDRDALGGTDFPYVIIEDGDGELQFGTEQFSTANLLETDVFTITNNFKLYRGEHTLTFGTHNEFYSIYNLFIPRNFGTYEYDNLDDFLNNSGAAEYDRSYSLVDDIAGDGSAAAADFNAMQLGFYAQDEWSVNNKLTLTAGLRIDIPVITSDPAIPETFNTETVRILSTQYDVANNITGGQAPSGQVMWSPRLGFNYNMNNGNTLRGGIGIFTSRIPFVWPGAMFNNNGLTQGRVREDDLDDPILFIPEVANQYINPNFTVPSGSVNIFTDDFKYPQVLRGNLAFDTRLPGDIQATFEGVYTKTLNNVLYQNVNSSREVDFFWTGGPDDRPVFTRSSLDPQYSDIYVGSNTNEGYTYTLTANLAKKFGPNLSATLAYTWGDAFAITEGTSSQNSSQWRGQVSIDGRNNPVFGRSDFATGHRVVSTLNFTKDWTGDGNFATTVSLFFSGGTGSAYSFVINNADNPNNETGSTSRERSLAYIPAASTEINLVDITDSDGNVTVSAAEQWQRLDAFIEANDHLSERRGQYAEKNGSFSPFVGIFDLAIRQDLGVLIGQSSNRLQLSFDVFNVANLINNKWGTVYFSPGEFNNYPLYSFEGYAADGTTPQFTFTEQNTGIDDFEIAGVSSRWRARIGVRYLFN